MSKTSNLTPKKHARRKPLARAPSASSLRAIPEIELANAQQNPFAAMIKARGYRVVEVPSKASLRDMPELDETKVKLRRNPYAQRLANEGEIVLHVGDNQYRLPVGKGRPKAARQTGPTSPRSVRFPDAVWQELEQRAAERGLTLHAALREAIAEWLSRPL